MYLNNCLEICTEPSEPFAPYPGQVLTLRYHIEKGDMVGFMKSREGITKVHREIVVVEVAYGSNANEYVTCSLLQNKTRDVLHCIHTVK